MPTAPAPDPTSVVSRLLQAMNAHDADAFATCMASDYDSVQPAHPDRAFRGREQVRRNWSAIFEDIPDFQAEMLRVATSGDEVWSEWHWHGQPAAGGWFEMRGVIIMGLAADQIAWARLFLSPVEAGAGIDAAVAAMGDGTAGA